MARGRQLSFKRINATADRLMELEDQKKDIEAEVKALRGALCDALDERETDAIETGRYLIERESYTRLQFDAKRFREDAPTIYELYCVERRVSQFHVHAAHSEDV